MRLRVDGLEESNAGLSVEQYTINNTSVGALDTELVNYNLAFSISAGDLSFGERLVPNRREVLIQGSDRVEERLRARSLKGQQGDDVALVFHRDVERFRQRR